MAQTKSRQNKQTGKADLTISLETPAYGQPLFGTRSNARDRAGQFNNAKGYRGKNNPANWRRFNP
jgi:hypothetical protein